MKVFILLSCMLEVFTWKADVTSFTKIVLKSPGAVSERSTQGQTKVTSSYPSIMKKRGFEQSNGLDGKPSLNLKGK